MFAVLQLALALLMATAPHSFYTAVGPFGAYNGHYIRDVATFYAALGAGLAISLRRPAWRVPALGMTAIQYALHSVNHLFDIAKANPQWTGYFDFFSLAAATLLLVWLTRAALAERASAPPARDQRRPAMTRLIPPEQAGAFTRLILRISRRKVARLTGRETEGMIEPLEAYARSPRLLLGYGMLEQATANQHRVAPRLKVLAELKAATLTQCEYCIDIGSQIARRAGIGDDQLRALPRYRESELFDELEKLVLDYAVGMSRTPVAVSDELFSELRRRFDDGQVVELTNVIALENMRGRFNLALGIGATGFSEGMVCAVPEDVAGRERLGEANGEPDARPAPATAHPQPGSARAG